MSTDPSEKWKRVWLLPAIGPATVIVTFVLFYRLFLRCPSEDAPCNLIRSSALLAGLGDTNKLSVLTYLAKASWVVVNGVHFLACVAALIVAAAVIKSSLSSYPPARQGKIIRRIFAGAAFFSILIALLTTIDINSPAQQFLRLTVGASGFHILGYTRVFDVTSLTAVMSLWGAACAVLWVPDPTMAQDVKQLALRMRLLRYVLYVSAALLVVGVLRLSTTLDWGASFFANGADENSPVRQLVKGLTGTMGANYTLLMAAMYLPTALILRARAQELVPENEADPATWLTKNGLSWSFSDTLPRIIAILAPLATGPFLEIISKLVGDSAP